MDAELGEEHGVGLCQCRYPAPRLFLSELLDHPDHIFKTTLEHIGFSSLPVMLRAFWK